MANASLEHVNLTVTDPEKTVEMIQNIFGWKIRWQGKSASGGDTIHVGTERAYLAIYSPHSGVAPFVKARNQHSGLNHVGIVVSDLDATEARVKAVGLTPFGHDDYEPGRRFYFLDTDGIEFEVISYAE
ncbi:MAG: VOC family protein [Pseudomonadota bacterium]